MKSTVLLAVALTACTVAADTEAPPLNPSSSTSDTDDRTDTDENRDTDVPGDTDTDVPGDTDTDPPSTAAACPGDFPSGEGPGCCTSPNALTPDVGRASCNAAGEWVCAQGQVCSCQGSVAGYECLDACAWTVSEPPGCIFSDHFECFAPTEVDARTCP